MAQVLFRSWSLATKWLRPLIWPLTVLVLGSVTHWLTALTVNKNQKTPK